MKYGLFIIFFCYANLSLAQDYHENQLQWPTHLSESDSKIGGVLHQYQKFPGSKEYFHEGVDYLGGAFQEVFTPVSGTIDAGYYSYTTLESGLSEKTYISLRDIDLEDKEPKLWGQHYFEVSITDEFNNRFEFHHIDRLHLPPNIVESIYNGGYITEGMQIGNIIPWPRKVLGRDYNHIHYSILSPDGVYLNPFWFSEKIPDTRPPQINTVYFELEAPCPKTGIADHFSVSKLRDGDKPTYMVIKTKDFLDNNRFSQSPTKVFTKFSDGETHLIDFTYALLGDLGIQDLYVNKICFGDPASPFILDASSNFEFYMKIPIPENFSGSASVTFSDYAGNESNILVNIHN